MALVAVGHITGSHTWSRLSRAPTPGDSNQGLPHLSPYPTLGRSSQQAQVTDGTRGDETDVEVGRADRDEADPRERHVVRVQAARAPPHRVLRARGAAAREAVEPAADEMARRVAREAVARERGRAREQDERADAQAEGETVAHGIHHVPPEKEEVHEGDVEEVAVEILEDQREGRLATVARAAELPDGTRGRVEEVRA